ncbi:MULTISPECIES: SMI1/KNR4 family protein [Bacillus]|uniref:SMI1/KNR4 family protein n=1 Tax=Bacillus TaxID=1386 RepID=UPI000BF603D5|nr:SMI1/KNR4 family protein [Bacillus cereus]RFB16770.1 SMI1/KNR4 family protein [Bacillus sp. OE]RFB21138.1 SMI1/KNR4 family protein [Bacillus sp. LB(2018)]PFM07920.1 1,3-beta-glucan synthase regulator [Bacillus cereus]PGS14877.1 1,3-beta-glucan synthase regulator [Bacillus cereus]
MRKVEWQFADEAVNEDLVREISNKIGFKFPIDYIKCVAVNNGANVEPELFNVNNHERIFGTLLSFNENSDEYIVDVYSDFIDTLPKELFPFAFDPAGNLICFDYKNHEEDPIVVFWEHEGAWEKETLMESEGITAKEAEEVARENVFYIANNFTEFLNKLHD